MSFKFFRKHQKVMLWIIVVITVFTFSLFSVTSTMRACFEQETLSFGVFTSKDGSEVEITERDYRGAVDMLRRFTGVQSRDGLRDEDVFVHIILRHEAEAAGIRVSDHEISESLKAMGLTGTKEDYFTVLKRMNFDSATRFEEGLRELMLVNKYRAFLTLTDDLITSEDIYESYKLDHEEFKVDFVSFPYADYGADLTVENISEDDLSAWYEGLRDSSKEVRDHFSEPEKYEFDVAYLDVEEANYDDYAGLIEEMEINVAPSEITRHYDMVKDARYVIETEEEPGEEEPAELSEEEEAPAEGEEDSEPEEDEKPVEYVKETEVKDQLEKELKLAKLVEKCCMEWVDYARENNLIGKSAEELAKEKAEKAAEEAAKEAENEADKTEDSEDDSTESDEEAADQSEDEKTHDEVYAALIEKYRLKQDRIEGPVYIDDLGEASRFGTEMMKLRVRMLKENNARYIAPADDCPNLAFFVKVTELVDRRKKGLDEVLDSAKEQYIKKEQRELAERAARDFVNNLETKARELDEVKETIAQWEADAKEKADASVEVKEDTTEEEAARMREIAEKRELAMLQPEIATLLKRHLYKFFNEVATETELNIETLDYYSKSLMSDRTFYEQEDSPQKYVMGNRRIFDLDTNAVTDPLNDQRGESLYVVRVLDRRFPPASSMADEDFESAKRSMEQQRLMELRYPQMRQGPPEEKEDPFAWEKMVKDYSLRFPMQQAAEAEAAANEEQDRQ